LVSLLSERLDGVERSLGGPGAAALPKKAAVRSSESSDRLEAELRAIAAHFSEWLTKLELEVTGLRDALTDEASLASKIPQVNQLSQWLSRLDNSVTVLQQGLGETHQLCVEVHETAKDNIKGLLVLTDRVTQLDTGVLNLVATRDSSHSEPTKQLEFEHIHASCREAREAAESIGIALRSDIDSIVKACMEDRQNVKPWIAQTEKLKARLELVAAQVDLFAKEEAKGMQQGLQALDKLCDTLKHEGTQQKLLVGENAKANLLASDAAPVSSGASATLKPGDTWSREDVRPAAVAGATTPVVPDPGIRRSPSPVRQIIEVKVETRNTTPPASAKHLSAQPSSTVLNPSGSPALAPPPSRSRDLVGDTGNRSPAAPGMRMVGLEGDSLHPRQIHPNPANSGPVGPGAVRRSSLAQQLLVPPSGGGAYAGGSTPASRSRGSSPAVVSHRGLGSSGQPSDCGSPRNRSQDNRHTPPASSALLMPGSGALRSSSRAPGDSGSINPGVTQPHHH